jgi:hypothetical protein
VYVIVGYMFKHIIPIKLSFNVLIILGRISLNAVESFTLNNTPLKFLKFLFLTDTLLIF